MTATKRQFRVLGPIRASRILPLLLLLALPAAQAQFTYTTNNGTITITQYKGPGGAVTIPDKLNGLPVTSIGIAAFRSDTLANLTIPKSVTSIGRCAFVYCHRLTAITVDALNPRYSSVDGVLFNKRRNWLIQYPGGRAGSYTVPSNVASIGEEAFLFCADLSNVVIPKSVTKIGGDAFDYCASLRAITVDEFNPFYSSVDGVLFNKSQTTLIQHPAGKAGTYTIPNSVTSIGPGAFSGCTTLTNLTIPNSVTNIGNAAFRSCPHLANITMGEKVTTIGAWAFDYCTSLTGVYFQGNSPSAPPTLFKGATKATVYYRPGTKGWRPRFGGRPTARWEP
jgi:hypothetical protein